ncbi:hypothetical protein [Lysinibacillus xylanilyticus]
MRKRSDSNKKVLSVRKRSDSNKKVLSVRKRSDNEAAAEEAAQCSLT